MSNGNTMWHVKLIDEDADTKATLVFELGTVDESAAFKQACKLACFEVEDFNQEDCIIENHRGTEPGSLWVVIFGDDEQGEME